MKYFKDFVGFRDGAGGVGSGSEQMSSSDSQRLRPERLIGDSAMEIGELTLLTSNSSQTVIYVEISQVITIRFRI